MSQHREHAGAGAEEKRKQVEKIQPHQYKWDTAPSKEVQFGTISHTVKIITVFLLGSAWEMQVGTLYKIIE